MNYICWRVIDFLHFITSFCVGQNAFNFLCSRIILISRQLYWSSCLKLALKLTKYSMFKRIVWKNAWLALSIKIKLEKMWMATIRIWTQANEMEKVHNYSKIVSRTNKKFWIYTKIKIKIKGSSLTCWVHFTANDQN